MENKPGKPGNKKKTVHRSASPGRKTVKVTANKRETEFRKLFFLINLSVALHEIVYDASGKAIDYKIVDVNPMYETVTGVSKKQAVGKSPKQLFHVVDPPNLNIYAEVASSGKSISFETYFPAMAVYAQVFVFSTKLGTFTTIISDITGKKRTEEALKQSETENRELLETANSIIIRWDSNRKIKFINDFGLRFFGYSADELVGNDIMILVPHVDTGGRDMETFIKDIVANTQNHPSSSNENIRKDGRIVQVIWTNKAIYDSHGQVKEILAIGNDISELKRTEDALKESEAKANALIKHAPTGIFEIDYSKQRFLSMNDAVSILTGYSKDELFALGPSEFLIGDSKKLFADRVRRQLAGENINDSVEFQVRKKDGSVMHIILNISFSRDKPNIAFVIGHDISERIREEEKLKESEERFSKAFHSSPVGLSISRIDDGTFIDVNQSFLELFGYKKEEIIGQKATKIVMYDNPVDRTRIIQLLEGQGKIFNYEVTARTKAGVRITTLVSAEKIELNSRTCVIWTTIDITERKEAEEKLIESETRFRALVATGSDTIYRMSPDWNEMLNLNSQGFLSGTEKPNPHWLQEYIPLEDQPYVTAIINEAIRTKSTFELEHRVWQADGGIGWTYSKAIPRLDANGEIIEWFGAANDITPRKQAEEKLKESEERYRALVDLAPDAIMVHHDGNIYYANTSALRLFGASTYEELATHNLLDLIHPDDRESASASIQTVEQGMTTVMTERRAIRLDGQPWVLEAAGTPIRWKNELCVQVMIRDITARKKTQEEVARLNRELRAINECDQVIVHSHDEQTLLSDVCRILCTSAGYRMAWVGSVEHDEAKSVRPLAWCGDEEYITNARITWADNERGRGPTGLAVRNNKTHFFQDFASEPAAAPWREAALLKGFRSSIALPLAGDDGKVFAVFTLYSSEPNYFDTAEVKLLEALAGDIAFGIVAIREKVKRQQAEVEIIHLASFPELNPNPVLEIEPDSNIIYANPAAKTHFPLMTKGHKHQFLMDFINSLKKMGTGSITKDIKIGDSWYEETLALVSSTKTYMIYARDITSRKNAEVALQETRDYLNNLLDYANAPIIVWDPSFHITQFNHAFERLIDRTAEDVIGKHLDILFPEEQREHSMEHIRRAVSGERMEVEEITIRHKDSSVRTVLWNSATLYDQDNKTPLATIAQGQDITERKVAEDELKQRTIDLEASNKELEAFSYSVSHDLRAPLRSITGFSNVLLEDYNDELDSEGKSYLKRISDSGELMGQLMDDLLKLSRVTRSELSTEKLDLSEMARKIVRELAEDEPKRKVKVTIAPDMTADGDKNLLGLVLQNLLGNAWKYTSKTAEPRIEMGTIQRNSKMAYFIRDNGVGFDMTYANKLFQPFQRLHKATEFAGTGIGLATVQRIIRRHGGEVWAEAKVGEGATFYFTLD